VTKLIGLMPVRNEAWVLPFSGRALLTWADAIVFLDHASTDDTPAILAAIAEEAPDRVLILREPDPTWAEMDHRQRMLEAGRDLGGTHFAIVDADEVLAAHLRERVRVALPIMPQGFTLELPLLNCWRSLDTYRNDTASLFGSAWTTLLFRDRTDLSWAPKADGYQHHNRRPINAWPGMRIPPMNRNEGGLLHLQHASWRRLVAKHRLYKLQEVLRWPERSRALIDRMYNQALDEAGAKRHPVPPEWWAYPGLDRSMIDIAAQPWQELEVARLLAEHGEEMFEDLDLFEAECRYG
jgi:hypothetical protein